MPLVTDSSTLAPNEMNANTNSCGVTRRFDNKTLPFSQHKENYGLLLFDFANHSLIHIFTLQNRHIVSISAQSHRVEANVSSSPNNCNASLQEKVVHVLLLVVWFVVLDADDYFTLVAFQMTQLTLYVA